MVTCYDFSMARILAETSVDCLLVGDSAAMVMHGYSDTIHATMSIMALHTKAVAKGAPDKFLIADMPFLSYRKELSDTMDNVDVLMKAGAHAVKLEGAEGNLETIRTLVQSGVPVMGHLGLTPQSVHVLGGYKVQGRTEQGRQALMKHAAELEQSGCFAIVLECIPSALAGEITRGVSIPTIGIGSGPDTDGQVLVLQDLLGMQKGLKLKFVKTYVDGHSVIKDAVEQYCQEVVGRAFPVPNDHTFQ